MRHKVKGRKLSRTASHRKATLQALSVALINEKRIKTTVSKAKELRPFVEPLITRAKVDNSHNRREVFSKLQDKHAVSELFNEVGPLAKDRPGGYTRIIKIGFRPGDATDMALIELVDYNDVPPEKETGKRKRTRRAGKSKKTTPADPSKEKITKEEAEETAAKVETDKPDEQEVVDTAETSADFLVDEVEEKLEEMSVEEATSFVGDDERVTVQKALKSKIDAAEESSSEVAEEEAASKATESSGDFLVDEVKEKLEGMSVEEAKDFVGEDERVTVQDALQKKIKAAEESSSDESSSEDEKE